MNLPEPKPKADAKRKTSHKHLLWLHLNILLYSAVGVLSKLAANAANERGLFSWAVAGYTAVMLAVLAVYAFFYQKLIKVMDLTVAYANRSILTMWTLVWAALFFHEPITAGNLAGSALIAGGIWLVVQSE
ncbi:MAG: DMT family transporter [Clostridiales bacterium]|nr:DMT family transporter [Clostridiales bacterium]